MSEEAKEIYVVDISYGKVRIASVMGVEKKQVWVVDRRTQKNYLGSQYIGIRIRKGENIFLKARDATVYAAAQLAKIIDRKQEELNDARDQLQELYRMLGK
jgi:hypothetical protein